MDFYAWWSDFSHHLQSGLGGGVFTPFTPPVFRWCEAAVSYLYSWTHVLYLASHVLRVWFIHDSQNAVANP